ncbi:hypothetical protein [Glaciimonas sp. PCH181]|uniref:hypothetical protein n=1 Tax=Glaciimonas sp. PCH181 TaxID=2133943 RepID=UPI000D356D1E|nr:hypothetical protein [Glaciimonas sp. PCH181]PUA19358.1 hypothetical protein C7W93_05670 [Glaciimonas sp. PCH181]
MIRIAVSGHQARPGIDWKWTAFEIEAVLRHYQPIRQAFTSLAVGSDQVFAREALALDIPVSAVIPMIGYERFFTGSDLESYEALLEHCNVIRLDGSGDDDKSFLDAGRYVVDSSDLLVAIWDGQRANGLGGTANIVAYCIELGRTVVHINPLLRTVRTINEALFL